MPSVVPPAIDAAALAGAPVPAGLSADEKHAYEQLAAFYKDVYYAFFMGTRSQTLAALSDSPVGLATFMIDHDARSLELTARSFPDELFQAPKSWAEKAYPNLIHFNKLPKGGHFAAWEQPKFLSEELRAGFKSLRA